MRPQDSFRGLIIETSWKSVTLTKLYIVIGKYGNFDIVYY